MMNIPSSKEQWQRKINKESMPDITSQVPAEVTGALQRVGMSNVEMPLRLLDAHGQYITVPAKADLYVSLDKEDAKGIHMSRLYLLAQEHLTNHEMNAENVEKLLQAFLDSHKALSKESSLKLAFDYMLRRPALLSQNAGWRFYPVAIEAVKTDQQFDLYLTVQITYSSTCPCSAALSRQLMESRFEEEFEGQEMLNKQQLLNWLDEQNWLAAAPHGQRSVADVTVKFSNAQAFNILQLINNVEESLATAVQTAVKREDEQEFARLNAENLMFCEDSARRIKQRLDELNVIADYRVEVAHLESLHAHDAVAIVTKGLNHGLRP